MNSGSNQLIPLDEFLAENGAFFESQGYRVTKTALVMEFTRLSDNRTLKLPALFNFVAGETTRESFLADLVTTLAQAPTQQSESSDLILLDDFIAEHSAFFESMGYRVKKLGVIIEFTRLSDNRTIKIPAIFNMVAADQTRELFIADVISTFDDADEENNATNGLLQ